MSSIKFYTELKIITDYDFLLEKLSEKVPEFKKNIKGVYEKEEIISELYKIRGMQKELLIDLDIFFSKDFFSDDLLNRESRFFKREKYSFIKNKEILINDLYKLLRIKSYVQGEIGKFFFNDSRFGLRRIELIWKDPFIKKLIEKIEDTKFLKHSLRDGFDMVNRRNNIELDENELGKEFDKIEKFIGKEDIDICKNDFYVSIKIPIDSVLKFLISKYEEQNIQVDTEKIENLFEILSEKSIKQAKEGLKYSIYLLSLIIILNILLIIFNENFNINHMTRYIPMLILEIILFKFMFFFFDKYNIYTKISSIYDYYVGLVQSDNIYTSDKKFTDEQNFVLREKTYLELTNLSSHIKGMIENKGGKGNSDIAEILKELNNISPLLKKMN